MSAPPPPPPPPSVRAVVEPTEKEIAEFTALVQTVIMQAAAAQAQAFQPVQAGIDAYRTSSVPVPPTVNDAADLMQAFTAKMDSLVEEMRILGVDGQALSGVIRQAFIATTGRLGNSGISAGVVDRLTT
jgi:hypothetical protein